MRNAYRRSGAIVGASFLSLLFWGAGFAWAQAPPASFEYAAKILCGIQKDPKDLRLAVGLYATTINIHNPSAAEARIVKKLALSFPPGDEKPGKVLRIAEESIPPDHAAEANCNEIERTVFGGQLPAPYIEGFVIIQSTGSLDVMGVYTTATLDGHHSSIDVEPIRERRRVTPPQLPDLVPVPDASGGFCIRDGQKLLVTVRNQGAGPAGPSQTKVDFGPFGAQTQPTPALLPGASATVSFSIPPGCFDADCEFRITVDSTSVVTESNEGNNTASGICIG